MAAKAEAKDVAKEAATTGDKTEKVTKTEDKKTEETAKEEKKDEMEEEKKGEKEGDDGKEEKKDETADDSKTEEPKPFQYKDSYNATAEEHEKSPYLWIRSKTLLQAVTENVDKTQAALKEVFTDKFEVSLPKVKLPLLMHLYVQMNDIEEKRKVIAGTNRPDKWRRPSARPMPDIVTQSVVIREEKYVDTEPGTLEEALDELLPHRKVVYKEQLTLKTKDLDETLDQVVKLTNEAIAKDRKFQKPATIVKPAMENIIPMVPNIGYDRNVALDLERDSKGKVTAGVRVQYEKDGVNKMFFVPVSECTHISPEIVKAAEAVAAHLSTEKFEVFDGINNSKDLYGLKFSMNDVGEIILSVVLVIDDKFVEEFYDVSDKEKLSKEVAEYFERVSKVQPKPKVASKQNGEEEGGDGEGEDEEDEAAAAIEETETVAGGEQKEGEKPVVNGTEKSDEKKSDEKKEKSDEKKEKIDEKKETSDEKSDEKKEKEEITIMRESAVRPVSLEKSPFLNRVSSQIRDHLSRFNPPLKKFFEEKCSSLGINGIYITWHATNNRPCEWNRNVKHWYHVCGSQSVDETISSVKLELYPHLESYHPSRTQVIPTLMNLLVDNLGIDSNSQIVLACDYYFVQNFFAQKCKKIMMMTFMNEMLRNDIKAKFKDSVSFISAKAKQVNIVDKCKRYFGEYPHSVIHWGQYQDMPIKRLFQHRVKKVAVVYDPRDKVMKKQANNLEVLKKMNLMLHPYYTLKKVFGLDVCPQRDGPPSVIAFYDAVGGHIPFFQRGSKRRNQFQAGGPGPKKPAQAAGRPNQGPGGRPNQGPGGGRPNQGPGPQGPRNQNQMNKRRGGGMGGPGGRGGFYQKRPRMDDRPQPMPMPRGPGGPRGRYNQRTMDRPQPMGRQPSPWGGDVRRDNYDRQNYNDERPAEHTVQAAKAVLSQLNTIIENQLLLANMNQGGGARNRPDEDWGRQIPPSRESFGSVPRIGGGGAGGSGLGGPPSYGNEPADYFSRDRSPPSLNLGGGFRPTNDFGVSRNRDFGGSRSGGGLGGPSGGNRRGGGGGVGGGGKSFRSNFTRR